MPRRPWAQALDPMGHKVLLGCQDSPASMGTVFWYAEGTWATSSKVDAFCRDKEKSRDSVLAPSQPGQLPRDCDGLPQLSEHLYNTDLLPQSCTPQTHRGSVPLLQTHQRPCRHTLLHLEQESHCEALQVTGSPGHAPSVPSSRLFQQPTPQPCLYSPELLWQGSQKPVADLDPG